MTDEEQSGDPPDADDSSSDESLSRAVIDVVSELSGVDPFPRAGGDAETNDALDPLYSAVDPEALDGVFRPAGPDAVRPKGYVTFPYQGYEVTVSSEGRISAERLDTVGETNN